MHAVPAARSAAQNLGAFGATLLWAALSGARGLRAAFTVAAVLYGLAALPLLMNLPRALAALLAAARLMWRRCGRGRPRLLQRGAARSDAPVEVSRVTAAGSAGIQAATATGAELSKPPTTHE